MVEVTFQRDSRQRLSSVFLRGHAGAGGSAEYDLVCAAVSAIAQAAYVGLTEVAKIGVGDWQRSAGELRFTIDPADRARDDVHAIVATAEAALRHLAAQYPAHLRVDAGEGS